MCPSCFVVTPCDPCSIQLLVWTKGNQNSQEAETPAQHLDKLNSVY